MLQDRQCKFHPLPFSANHGHPVAAGGQAGTPLVVQDDAEQAPVDAKPAAVIDALVGGGTFWISWYRVSFKPSP
jgi:hypothetical protein